MGFNQPQGAKWHSGSLGYTQLVNLPAENIEVPRRPCQASALSFLTEIL